jgi:hypothetical protein
MFGKSDGLCRTGHCSGMAQENMEPALEQNRHRATDARWQHRFWVPLLLQAHQGGLTASLQVSSLVNGVLKWQLHGLGHRGISPRARLRQSNCTGYCCRLPRLLMDAHVSHGSSPVLHVRVMSPSLHHHWHGCSQSLLSVAVGNRPASGIPCCVNLTPRNTRSCFVLFFIVCRHGRTQPSTSLGMTAASAPKSFMIAPRLGMMHMMASLADIPTSGSVQPKTRTVYTNTDAAQIACR